MHASVEARLSRLAPDQRSAATAPAGPVLCVAPAGSGKTTTLVARVAWLVDTGVPPGSIAAITFNRRAADELRERLADALAPLGLAPDAVRVRTFHALGREILRDGGATVEPLADRFAVLRTIRPSSSRRERASLDTAISRLKLDLCVTAEQVARDTEAGPIAQAFVDYERALEADNALDFDDLIVRAIAALESDEALLARWRGRCEHLLVDEVQDLDRSQLRLALLLAAPAQRIFLVGDDDQSIYGWRLADVRRLLGLAESALPGLRRVDLVTNYRCPAVVVARAVRLVAWNSERFAKRIVARPSAVGSLVLAPSPSDEADRILAVLDTWAGAEGTGVEGTRAVLARTNRELLPAVVAAVSGSIPFRAPAGVALLVESDLVDRVLELAGSAPPGPLLVQLAAVRAALAAPSAEVPARDAEARPVAAAADVAAVDGAGFDRGEDGFDRGDEGFDRGAEGRIEDDQAVDPADVAAAVLGWAVPFADLTGLRGAIVETRVRLAELRRDDAALTLATAHGTKGLEFDHVAVVDMDEGRFPSARSIADAEDPARALEEERRLAYVAWTRARRSLTLVYDPGAPSAFLLEAFDEDELALTA